MENLEIYKQLETVPKEAKKKISGGRLNGMTDIKPMWRIEKLTEVFGPCGFGWYTEILNKEIIDGANNEKIAVVEINLFIKQDNEWSKGIYGTGGSSFIANERNGLYTSDECFKMAYTDALSVACKSLGMGASVYWGDSKYKDVQKKEITKEEAENYVLTFGKNVGKKLTEVDKGYLQYLMEYEKTDEEIKQMIQILGLAKTTKELDNRIDLIHQINELERVLDIPHEKVLETYKTQSLNMLTEIQLVDCLAKLKEVVGGKEK